MIDRDQLTEALDYHNESDLDDAFVIYPAESQPIFEAARIVLDFPTDEMVEAVRGVLAYSNGPGDVLEAVRQTFFKEDA